MNMTEIYIQAATAAVALVALGIAVFEGRAARRHNCISVMPYLTLRHHLTGSKGKLGLTITNAGLGSAIVKKCLIEVDGDVIGEDRNGAWDVAVSKLGLSDLKIKFETITPKGVVMVGDSLWLMWCVIFSEISPNTKEEPNSEINERISIVKNALHRIKVTVEYESMYGNRLLHTTYPV